MAYVCVYYKSGSPGPRMEPQYPQCPEHGVKLLPWVPTDGEVFPTDASPCSKALKCKLLLEEGFLPPLGSQVFEGFAWLLGPWLVSVLLIRLTAILVYGQFEVRGLWPMCYGIFEM